MFFLKRWHRKDVYILIVDDEPGYVDSLRNWFSRLGYCVESALSGQGALEILKKRRSTGIVFLDILMPGMNGVETLAALRRTRPRLPVVMLTSSGAEPFYLDAYKQGANAFWDKSQDFYRVESLMHSLVRMIVKPRKR